MCTALEDVEGVVEDGEHVEHVERVEDVEHGAHVEDGVGWPASDDQPRPRPRRRRPAPRLTSRKRRLSDKPTICVRGRSARLLPDEIRDQTIILFF